MCSSFPGNRTLCPQLGRLSSGEMTGGQTPTPSSNVTSSVKPSLTLFPPIRFLPRKAWENESLPLYSCCSLPISVEAFLSLVMAGGGGGPPVGSLWYHPQHQPLRFPLLPLNNSEPQAVKKGKVYLYEGSRNAVEQSLECTPGRLFYWLPDNTLVAEKFRCKEHPTKSVAPRYW